MAKTAIRPDIDDGGLGFDLGIGPFGISYNSRDGGTFGVDAGIIGIEYNAQGGGELEYFGGLYSFEYERVGCTLVERGFIGGVHVTTDIRKVPNCDDEQEKKSEKDTSSQEHPEKDDSGVISEDLIDFPSQPNKRFVVHFEYISDLYVRKKNENGREVCGSGWVFVREQRGSEFTLTYIGEPHFYVLKVAQTIQVKTEWQRPSGHPVVRCLEVGETYNVTGWSVFEKETNRQMYGGFAVDNTLDYPRQDVPGAPTSPVDFSIRNDRVSTRATVNLRLKITVNDKPLSKHWNDVPPNKPPTRIDMDKECCKSMKRIEQALGVERLLKDKFYVPNELMIPGSEGGEYAEDYMGIYSRMISVINQAGFSPFRVELPTPADFPEGEEKPGLSYPSQQAALQAIMSFLVENKIEQRRQSILQLRLARMAGRMYLTIGKLWYRVTAILDGLGIPTRRKRARETLEFNLLESKKKPQGFKESSDELPDFKETEDELIDDFLQNSVHEFTVDIFKEGEKDIRRWLIYLLSKKG
ncbi:MAG: hypothetical protein F6K48_17645 [Okeania sp. SIO3H1]|uniref:hypothetical protein n=1 Tax=Okeania sp. SIO1I7 TaxID=2607772 RepID=UPI0013C7568A|nr:hypothetical protein [Okeania sp. SIO1I7]NEN90633.1 hypothetical protein [Okeania sp. SIO3H1]NET24985.1 hypothetical protein [Okeania sp. SIO1I7]